MTKSAYQQSATNTSLKEPHLPTRLSQFQGTDNPRHLRAIHALLRRPMPREQLDEEVGCSNSPDLIAELRRRGLEVPCVKIPIIDRDGKAVKRGVYFLPSKDRRRVFAWLARCKAAESDHPVDESYRGPRKSYRKRKP